MKSQLSLSSNYVKKTHILLSHHLSQLSLSSKYIKKSPHFIVPPFQPLMSYHEDFHPREVDTRLSLNIGFKRSLGYEVHKPSMCNMRGLTVPHNENAHMKLIQIARTNHQKNKIQALINSTHSIRALWIATFINKLICGS